ncbi:hypothetical protein L7F22_067767 [Adiantum nelumboides]|nr:hypothetical protein [Adiantum nelumboides]
MTNNFWKGVFENLGTRLNFSSAYHPQTDGQSEIANLTILDLLKSYVTEVDQRSQWEKYLPLVEYAYNNTVHTSTGKAPFEVIEGRSKSPLLLKVHGKIFAADEYSYDLKESFQKIKEAISISQQKQKAAANKHRRALAFKENDWILLKFPKARLRHTSDKNPTGHQKYYAKLIKRYYGPFQILKPINEMAYQLKLPKHWLIHNAFHVSLLKPYKGEPPSKAIMEDPPEVEDQEEILQPESILRHEDKVLRHVGGKLPINQVNPVMVKKFQDDRDVDTKRLVNNYIKLCNSIKVTCELCYSENDSIQKEVVDQVSKLGITKLVLETSSQNALTKALKKESTSAYVAKHAPDFCSVMVIRKGKLFSVKDATRPSLSSSSSTICSSSSIRSETSTLGGEPIEDQSMTLTSLKNGEGGMQATGQCNTLHVRLPQSASMSNSRAPLERMMPHSNDNVGLESATKARVRSYSALPSSTFSGFAPAAPFQKGSHDIDHRQGQDDDGKVLLINGLERRTSAADGFPGKSCPPIVHVDNLGGLANSATGNASLYGVADAAQLMEPNNSFCDALSQLSSEMDTLESHSSISEMEANEALSNLGFDLLQLQLNEAKHSSQQWAQKEAERQANNFKLAEEMVENARKKISEYERHRDAALNEAKVASEKISYYQSELDRAAAMLKAALQQQEILHDRLAEEVRRHVATQKDLETTRRMAETFALRAELADRELQAERDRSKETNSKLKEVIKQLEKERQLRKEAEERASQDAFAKRQAVMALRKEQMKYTEYSFLELQIATDSFHEHNKLGQGGYGPVYKGRLHHTTVAIKVLATESSQGHEEFQKEVELLSRIHHPHMVMLLGACPENGSIIYEYMANGSLEDRLNCKDDTPPLPWYIRFRICLEVSTALLFLHSHPQPVVHRDLKPGNILLDHHFVSKISDVGVAKLVPNNVTFSVTVFEDTVLVGTLAYMDPDYQRTGVVSCESDVYSLGIIMLQLLTGRQPVGVTHFVEQAIDHGRLEEILDKSAGVWPLEEAMALACLSLQCTEPKRKHRPNLERKVLPELERIQDVAGRAAANMVYAGSSSGKTPIIPGSFFCPISQEIMQNPCIAADGFTYERDAIKVWLEEHDTSPMTNLVLSHKALIPNLSLVSDIQEWNENGLLLS